MSGKIGFILSVSVATALLAVSAGAAARESAAASPAAQESTLPEVLLQKNCQGCHDLRPIQTSAMDAGGWTKTIRTMIDDNGAEVREEDIPALVKYLVQNHGPVPEGPGKRILLNTCTMCHDLGRIKTGRRSSEEWEETLISMLNEGAPLSDAEFPVIHEYLSKNFNVQ
jgi:sulfite dehydrogenase